MCDHPTCICYVDPNVVDLIGDGVLDGARHLDLVGRADVAVVDVDGERTSCNVLAVLGHDDVVGSLRFRLKRGDPYENAIHGEMEEGHMGLSRSRISFGG